ncbi:MAG: GNAT family N-acetyltransferase [Armatimonadetes bacterium]|nr:GNAT family N-acetyltransferase [Armatimonadota bacterium]
MKYTHSIVKAPAPTPQQDLEVEQLAQICREREGLELSLDREPVRRFGESNQLFCYENGVLIGFVCLVSYTDIEAMGMVHPDHRRKGVGRALLEGVKAECRLRGSSKFLLVCEAAAPDGAGFARAVAGMYRFSEYRMELNPALFMPYTPPKESAVLERAGIEDLDRLVSIQAEAFGDTEEESRKRFTRWLQEPNQRFTLGLLNGEAAGMLRVATFGTPPDARVAYICSFGVLPAYQGRGYGRQILSKTVGALLTEGLEAIRIEVNVANCNALSLYKSCGFEEISEYQYYEVMA